MATLSAGFKTAPNAPWLMNVHFSYIHGEPEGGGRRRGGGGEKEEGRIMKLCNVEHTYIQKEVGLLRFETKLYVLCECW